MKVFLSSLGLILSCLVINAGPTITLTNNKGQSFDAELIHIQDEEVTVRRTSDEKVFTLKRSALNAETNMALKEARETLPTVHPEYDIDVVIGKRSKDLNGSSRSHVQEVSCTVRVINTDHNLSSPGVKGRAIFLGKELGRDDVYQIIATRDFTASPPSDETIEIKLTNFKTEYYKSYSESGTIYEAHLIILHSKDNEVIFHKSPDAIFERAIEKNVGLLEAFLTVENETYVNRDMQLTDYKGNLINEGKHGAD